MSNKIQNLKGFRDFLPERALKREWLEKKIATVFERWGYDPMETPTLEPLELFEGQIGEDEKLFYKFTDPGGREVALRYDQTVPTCRVVGQNWQTLPTPFKRYQIQSAFRAENTQKGRYREFLQCDADIFGIEGPLADAEVIALSLAIYKEIGFKEVKVLINDRALLKDIPSGKAIPYEAIVAVDKLKKIGEEGVVADMIKKGISESDAKDYLEKFKNLEPSENLEIIFDYLAKMGFDQSWYEFEPTLARSFSYSSGPIWEVVIPEYQVGSVLGGERFDQLVEQVSGVSVPATGFAIGFDRTLEAAQEAGLVPEIATKTQILVTVFDGSLLDRSIEIANKLRELGVRTEVYPDSDTRLEKQFKYADKKGIRAVITVGPDEAAREEFKIKNMDTGVEKTLVMENFKGLDKLSL